MEQANNMTVEMLIIGTLIGLPIFLVMQTVFLRAAASWVAEDELRFGSAMYTAFLLILAGYAFGAVVSGGLFVTTGSLEAMNTASLITMPIGIMIQSAVISSRLDVGYAEGCLIWVVMQAIAIGCFVAFLAVIGLVGLAVGAFS